MDVTIQNFENQSCHWVLRFAEKPDQKTWQHLSNYWRPGVERHGISILAIGKNEFWPNSDKDLNDPDQSPSFNELIWGSHFSHFSSEDEIHPPVQLYPPVLCLTKRNQFKQEEITKLRDRTKSLSSSNPNSPDSPIISPLLAFQSFIKHIELEKINSNFRVKKSFYFEEKIPFSYTKSKKNKIKALETELQFSKDILKTSEAINDLFSYLKVNQKLDPFVNEKRQHKELTWNPRGD